MNLLHKGHFKVDSRPAHTEYAQRLAVSEGISKGALAFAMVLYGHFNHKRHDAYPKDQRIMDQMAKILSMDVSDSSFQKARCAAFKACLFVYVPQGGPNKQNIYRLLQFWRPDDKGEFKPIDHAYPGFQKGAGRRKLNRKTAAPKFKSPAVTQAAATQPTEHTTTANCGETQSTAAAAQDPSPIEVAQAAESRRHKAVNALHRKFSEYDSEELELLGIADEIAINIALEFGLDNEEMNFMMNRFEQCTTLNMAPAH
jgi:hypothetical protein